MKTYEVFTEKYSKIYQADGIESVIRKHHKVSNDEIVAVTIADRPDLLSKIEQLEPEGEVSAEITRLQEKYDENGYDCTPLIKLMRIEDRIDSVLRIYQKALNVQGEQPAVSEEEVKDEYNNLRATVLQHNYAKELESYIEFLGLELDELAVFAHVHGWRTKRKKDGEMRRAELKAIKELLNQSLNVQGDENKQLENGRDYLMQVLPSEITIDDTLEAFGFGRNGLSPQEKGGEG